MYLIDTNIFLEILLEQEKADECQLLLEKIYNEEIVVYVSSFTLHSIEVILDRYKKLDVLDTFLMDIYESKGLKRIESTTFEEIMALRSARRQHLDIDDAINYYLAKNLKLKIVSFDKHFDKTDLTRITPKDIL